MATRKNKINTPSQCIEKYVQPNELVDLRIQWGRAEELDMHAHIVYDVVTLELIYYTAATSDFKKSIPKKTFLEGWYATPDGAFEEKRFYKTTYALPRSQAPKKMKLPQEIENILAPTHGYLLYQDQMTTILKMVHYVKPALIPMYIRNWNLKKPETRLLAATVWINGPRGVNLDDMIEDRVYDSENQFLFS